MDDPTDQLEVTSKEKEYYYRWYNKFVQSRVRELSSGSAAKVLMVLGSHVGKDPEKGCWPSYGTICEEAGVCRDTLADALKELEQAGIVKVKRREGRCSLYILDQGITVEVHQSIKSTGTHTTKSTGTSRESRLEEDVFKKIQLRISSAPDTTKALVSSAEEEKPLREIHEEMELIAWMEKTWRECQLTRKLFWKLDWPAGPRGQQTAIGVRLYREAWLTWIESGLAERAYDFPKLIREMYHLEKNSRPTKEVQAKKRSTMEDDVADLIARTSKGAVPSTL